MDEDEGFSDWTQKLERRTRLRMEENEELKKVEKNVNAKSRQIEKSGFTTSTQDQQIQDREEEEKRPENGRMEISESVSSQRPEEWRDGTRHSKKQPEIKLTENKVQGEFLQY